MRPTAAVLAVVLLSAVATQVVALDGPSPARATPIEKVFLVPPGEGYGVGECLTGGPSECGQVVADSWCEAQGFASAASYGLAAQDEYTGAIEATPKKADRPIRITCRD